MSKIQQLASAVAVKRELKNHYPQIDILDETIRISYSLTVDIALLSESELNGLLDNPDVQLTQEKDSIYTIQINA